MHMHWTECMTISLCAYLLKLKETGRLPTQLLAVPFRFGHPLTHSAHALLPALSVMHSFPPFQSCTHSRPFSQAHSKHCQVSSFGCTTTRQTNPRAGHACLSNMSSSGNIDRLGQQHVGPLVIGSTSFRKPATYPMCSLMRLF